MDISSLKTFTSIIRPHIIKATTYVPSIRIDSFYLSFIQPYISMPLTEKETMDRTIVIPAEAFAQFVESCSSDIHIKSRKKEIVTFKSGSKSFQIKEIVEPFPVFEESSKLALFASLPLTEPIVKALNRASKMIDPKSSYVERRFLFINKYSDDSLWFNATDGNLLTGIRLNSPVETQNTLKMVCLTKAVVQSLTASNFTRLDVSYDEKNRAIQLLMDDTVEIRLPDPEMETAVLFERFLSQKRKNTFQMTVTPAFIDMVKTAEGFSKPFDSSHPVAISLNKEENKITIMAQNDYGDYEESLPLGNNAQNSIEFRVNASYLVNTCLHGSLLMVEENSSMSTSGKVVYVINENPEEINLIAAIGSQDGS